MNIRQSTWNVISRFLPAFLRRVYHMDIGQEVHISLRAHLDKSINPRGIHIGDRAHIASDAYVLAHDRCRGVCTDTYIGEDTLVGIHAIIMPGVRVGKQVIVGAGSVVTKDVPDNCIVAGNPARVIKTGIKLYDAVLIENEE